jgi:Mce-associated membrane protein
MSKRTSDPDVFEQARDVEPDAADLAEPDPDAGVSETDSADSEPAESDVTDSADDGAERTKRPRTVVVLLTVSLIVIAAAAGFLGWRQYQQYRLDQATATALQAAEDYAVVLTTLDAKNIDDNYRKSLDGATGEFKDAYSQGANQLRQVLIDNKASGTGVVVAAAVKSATPDKVEVLLFVDQSITNAQNPSPRIDRNRIDITMDKVGDRWLAGKVEIL